MSQNSNTTLCKTDFATLKKPMYQFTQFLRFLCRIRKLFLSDNISLKMQKQCQMCAKKKQPNFLLCLKTYNVCISTERRNDYWFGLSLSLAFSEKCLMKTAWIITHLFWHFISAHRHFCPSMTIMLWKKSLILTTLSHTLMPVSYSFGQRKAWKYVVSPCLSS